MSSFSDDSHARCWVKAGISGNVLASFNITSVTDTGTGVIDITIATDFSSANWACVTTVENIDASIDNSTDVQSCAIGLSTQTAGAVQLTCGNASGAAAVDPTTWHMVGFGAQ